MLPCASFHDSGHRGFRYLYSSRDGGTRLAGQYPLPNSPHHVIIQLCVWMRAALRAYPPAFLPRIEVIVSMCANKQMAWIDAACDIAAMTYKYAMRDWAMSQFPRVAVRGNQATGDYEPSVPGARLPHPRPALCMGQILHIRPESCRGWDHATAGWVAGCAFLPLGSHKEQFYHGE